MGFLTADYDLELIMNFLSHYKELLDKHDPERSIEVEVFINRLKRNINAIKAGA